MMTKAKLNVADVIDDAIEWLDTLDERDADRFVDELIEHIITVLRRDARMPQLTSETWRLLFADAAERGKADLAALIAGMGDCAEAAERTIEALMAAFSARGVQVNCNRKENDHERL
jgi:hypothetical protein